MRLSDIITPDSVLMPGKTISDYFRRGYYDVTPRMDNILRDGSSVIVVQFHN